MIFAGMCLDCCDSQEHNIRATMVTAMRERFAHLKLQFSIGGQISFDVFPEVELEQILRP
jgi:hypothetical protein